MRARKYFQCLGNFEAMLAVAQTGLAFCDSRQRLTSANTHLRLMCGVACFALGRAEDAKGWLLGAMRLNLHHGCITSFGSWYRCSAAWWSSA